METRLTIFLLLTIFILTVRKILLENLEVINFKNKTKKESVVKKAAGIVKRKLNNRRNKNGEENEISKP